jgi:transcription elongation factor Elf1
MSRGITIKFNTECPHCGQLQHVGIVTIGEIDGDTFQECRKCGGQYVIVWSFEVEADVFKCDKKSADVQCDFSLSEGWDDDDDDDPEPE